MIIWIKVNCRLLDSNRGPLVPKATTLPTEPQPLPKRSQSFLANVYIGVWVRFDKMKHFFFFFMFNFTVPKIFHIYAQLNYLKHTLTTYLRLMLWHATINCVLQIILYLSGNNYGSTLDFISGLHRFWINLYAHSDKMLQSADSTADLCQCRVRKFSISAESQLSTAVCCGKRSLCE